MKIEISQFEKDDNYHEPVTKSEPLSALTCDLEQFRIGMKVRHKDDSKRMELDGDGIYFVVGLKAAVFLPWSSWTQEAEVLLLCQNGVHRALPEDLEIVIENNAHHN